MGLDTTHGAWNGSYSSFGTWREFIAGKIGINLNEMLGFGGSKKWDKKEPLTALLYHSDCDGHLTPSECEGIAKRLRELLLTMESDNPHNQYLKHKTELFAAGCELAVKQKMNLEFH